MRADKCYVTLKAIIKQYSSKYLKIFYNFPLPHTTLAIHFDPSNVPNSNETMRKDGGKNSCQVSLINLITSI